MIKSVVLLMALAFNATAQTPSATEKVIDVGASGSMKDCGLITRYPGNLIAPNCFQQSNNILTDRTGTLSGRLGYSQYNGTACPLSQAIRGMWPFFSRL